MSKKPSLPRVSDAAHEARFKALVQGAERQSKNFAEAARELGCDDDEKSFDAKLKKVAAAPPPESTTKRKTKKPAK